MGFRDDLRELRRVLGDLLAYGHDDEDAGYELASSARRFSRRTKEVVDDKLSFSATLMRAGEVHAANRLLAEVESDVRNEESALIERVNEVKTAAAARRERVTRARLARTLVAASISVGLMSFSAIGMAVAGWLEDRARQSNVLAAQSEAGRLEADRGAAVAGRRISERKVKIAGVRIDNKLSPAEMRTLNRLTAASDGDGIEQLLLGVLSPDLARKVREVLVKTTAAAESAGETIDAVATEVTKRNKKRIKKTKAQEPKAEQSPKPADEPSDDPSGGGGGGSGDDDGDSSGSGGGEQGEDEGSPLPPFPGL